jgi:ribosomal protein S27AE
MTELQTRTCTRCGRTAEQVKVGLLVSEPRGWTWVTVGGLPMCNKTVCPRCATDVRAFLAMAPDMLAAQVDSERELAFARGYDEGHSDALTKVGVTPE